MNSVPVAQLFPVGGKYRPTRISAMLDVVGENTSDRYVVESNPLYIDASLFHSIVHQDGNQIAFDDTVSGFTDSGYMRFYDNVEDGSYITYDVSFYEPKKYYIYLRVYSSSPSINIYLYIDGHISVSETMIVDTESWTWVKVPVVVAISNCQVGIGLGPTNALLDKVCISHTEIVPDNTASVRNHCVCHARIFSVLNDKPDSFMDLYGYKTSISDVLTRGWYSFNINNNIEFNDEYYALVIVSSGNTKGRYISWMADEGSGLNALIRK